MQLVRCDIYIFTDLAIICTEITSQLFYPKNNLKLAFTSRTLHHYLESRIKWSESYIVTLLEGYGELYQLPNWNTQQNKDVV